MPTPQETERYLRGLNTSDRVRAVAFDAVHNLPEDQAEQALRNLPFSDEIRAELWDMRDIMAAPVTRSEEQTLTPDKPYMASPEQFTDTTQPEGSAGGRFVRNLASAVNPVTIAKGVAGAVAHPVQTGRALIGAQAEQFGKAKDAFSEGRFSEAAGYAGAGTLPLLGPWAAGIGEQAGSGDVAGAMGQLAGGAAMYGAPRVAASRVRPIARNLRNRARQQTVQALGPTKEQFKELATRRVVPGVLQRGLGGSRESLQARAANEARRAGQAIDDLWQREGARQVATKPVIDALDDAVGQFTVQSGRGMPVVVNPRAVSQLNELRHTVQALGPEVRADQLRAVRQVWDKVVKDAGGFDHRAPGGIGKPLADVSEAATKRTAVNAIRRVLDDEVPNIGALNREFVFWSSLDDVLTQTMKRTAPQQGGLMRALDRGAGGVAGAVLGGTTGPVGAGIGAIVGGATTSLLHQALTSPRWRFASAHVKDRLASALMSRNPDRIGREVGRASATVGATSPTVSRNRPEPVTAR